jgi:hypothetical protein
MFKLQLFFLTLLLSIGSQGVLWAQVPTISDEIRSYKSQKELLIQGRYMLLDSLKAGKIEKVKEVRDYLMMDLDQDLLAFSPREYFLILYWTEEYDLLLDQMEIWAQEEIPEFDGLWILPLEDMILDRLARWTRKHRDSLDLRIDSAFPPGEAHDILHLFLNHLVLKGGVYGTEQEVLNDEASEFLEKYPNSSYLNLVREEIRYQWVLSPWFGGVTLGGGFNGLTNDLKTRYGNTGSLDLELFAGYQRWGLMADLHFGFTSNKVKESYTFDDGFEVEWPAGSGARLYSFGLKGFTHIHLGSKLIFAPIGGIGLSAIEPTESDMEDIPELEVFKTGYFETYSLGAMLRWKFGTSSNYNYSIFLPHSYREESTWYLQLKYVYSEPRFERKLTGFEGHYHRISLGIGGFGSSYIRKL